MSRSVTRVTLIMGIPLLTLAVVAIVGSQRPHSVVATRPAQVAFLRPLHPSVNHLARLVDDATPTPAPAAPAGPVAAPASVAAHPAPARPAPPKPAPPPVSIGGAAGVEFSLVNQDRAANGVAGLRFSGALARVAQYRAQDMLNRGYFSHYDPATGQLAF